MKLVQQWKHKFVTLLVASASIPSESFVLNTKRIASHHLSTMTATSAFRSDATTTTTNTNDASEVDSVNVTITSDLMCPWCYVGLRKLQEASKIANVDTNIVWKPYMLRPNLPEEGAPKGGTPASRVGRHLKAAGESVGIQFTGLTDKTPNTGLFHATMKWILEKEKDGTKQTEFQEEVFDAYFTRGVFPDQKLLLETARKIGVGAVVEELFNDTKQLAQMRKAVEKEAREASTKRGIDGVPFFEFDGYPAFSGAQDVRYFVQYLQRHAK